jgi:hypothetical protein
VRRFTRKALHCENILKKIRYAPTRAMGGHAEHQAGGWHLITQAPQRKRAGWIGIIDRAIISDADSPANCAV